MRRIQDKNKEMVGVVGEGLAILNRVVRKGKLKQLRAA